MAIKFNVSNTCAYESLKRLNFSYKKSLAYKERNEDKRREYEEEIKPFFKG